MLSGSRRSIFHPYGANKINVTFNPSDYLYNIFILFYETQFYFMIIGNDSEITQIGAAYINDKSFRQYCCLLKGFQPVNCSKWSNCCWEPNVQGMWTCSINIQIWRSKQLFTVALFNLWIWMQGKLFKDLLTHFHSLEKKCLDFAHTTKLTCSNISFKLTIMQMMQHLMQKLYYSF